MQPTQPTQPDDCDILDRVATIEAENTLGQVLSSISLTQCSYCKLASFSLALVKLLELGACNRITFLWKHFGLEIVIKGRRIY